MLFWRAHSTRNNWVSFVFKIGFLDFKYFWIYESWYRLYVLLFVFSCQFILYYAPDCQSSIALGRWKYVCIAVEETRCLKSLWIKILYYDYPLPIRQLANRSCLPPSNQSPPFKRRQPPPPPPQQTKTKQTKNTHTKTNNKNETKQLPQINQFINILLLVTYYYY